MVFDTIIADNTLFNYILKVKSVDFENIVKVLFKKVLIPSQIAAEMCKLAEIKKEDEKRILSWIEMSNKHQFYSFCDTYDFVILNFLKSKLDLGEAGAIAQAIKRNVYLFISDDDKNLPFIKEKYPNIRQHSIFFLLALADINGLMINYNEVLFELIQIRNYSNMNVKTKKVFKKFLREEYSKALFLKGINKSKRIISRKTSIDTILKGFPIVDDKIIFK